MATATSNKDGLVGILREALAMSDAERKAAFGTVTLGLVLNVLEQELSIAQSYDAPKPKKEIPA